MRPDPSADGARPPGPDSRADGAQPTRPDAGAGGARSSAAARLDLRPLTARSVLLSALLGTHPPALPVRTLVRAGALFGIPDGTVRVALSRMAAEGDVLAESGRYRLAGPLVARQRRQDEGRAADTLPWDGQWELVIADPTVRGVAARADLEVLLSPRRLAEWRDGVWARPANLVRSWPASLPRGARRLTTGLVQDPAALAGALWDLPRWASRALDLLTAMESEPDAPTHFAVAAATVQHLRDDPLLPPEVLPDAWPGSALRHRYTAFEADLSALLRTVASRRA